MYSPAIVERNLDKLRKQGMLFQRRPADECRYVSAALGKLIGENGQLTRALASAEAAFIRSETILCRADFRYWAERYGYLELDASVGGGVGPINFWESQEHALRLIGKREEECWSQYEKHGFGEGITTVWHKARQLGATAIMRLISMHRMEFYRNTRLIAASLDEDKVQELYTRDKVVLNNQPFYLSPKIEFDVKNQHLSFENLKSRLIYQQANQQAGIGTGSQFDMFHFTEVAMWNWADRIKIDFLPAVPKHPNVFGAMESTAYGRNNYWHDLSESARKRDPGFEGWTYIFAPYYIEPTKYRRSPPEDWTPQDHSRQHADMVERTSPELLGKTYRLTKDQLYWWETEREMYRKDGSLHMFLTNYCATPDESFQHGQNSALPIETIEWMRSNCLKGMPYTATDIAFRA